MKGARYIIGKALIKRGFGAPAAYETADHLVAAISRSSTTVYRGTRIQDIGDLIHALEQYQIEVSLNWVDPHEKRV